MLFFNIYLEQPIINILTFIINTLIPDRSIIFRAEKEI